MAETKQTMEEKKESKKKSGGMGCLVMAFILILTPILVLVGMYFLSHDFQLYANNALSSLPGGIGDYFASRPTRTDELQQVREVADFIMSLDDKRAMDKLKLIKSKDRRIYDDLVKEMVRLNPNRTKTIIESLRQSDTPDLLNDVLSEINSERAEEIKAKSNSLAGLSDEVAKEEILRIVQDLHGYEKVAEYIELMDVGKAMNILYRLASEDRNRILSLLTEAKAMAIRDAYSTFQKRNQALEQIASIMKRENIENVGKAFEEYSDEDKVVLLRKMGPRVAGRTLAFLNDSNLALDLISQVKTAETLENGKDEITGDMINSLKVYRDYADRIKELVDVYLKMDSSKVSQIVNDVVLNPEPPKIYRLNNGDNIEISNEDVLLEILRRFPEKRLAEVLSKLDDKLSAELTIRLALP